MAANSESQTVSEYIVHHLTNLTYGKLPAGLSATMEVLCLKGSVDNGARGRRERRHGF